MTSSRDDRKLTQLYAGLTDRERARLLARYWREGNGPELDRLRAVLPDDRARRSYSRAVRALSGVNSSMFLGGMMLARVGLERDAFAAQLLHERHRQRQKTRLWLLQFWELTPVPVTKSEYATIVALERAELITIDSYILELWESVITRPDECAELRPELAAVVQEFRHDLSDMAVDALWDRFVGCFSGAIQQCDLVAQQTQSISTEGASAGPCLPRGALTDWAEGTTSETYVPLGPEWGIPTLELFYATTASYQVYRDEDAEAVRERRAQL